jgi:acetyl esterase/lipase
MRKLILAIMLLAAPLTTAAQEMALTIPETRLPFSSYASDEARAKFAEQLKEAIENPAPGDILAARAYYDRSNSAYADRMRQLYPVSVESREMGGVRVDVVTPRDGVPEKNRGRVLINLHGGAFMWGGGSGGLVESIPIASVGRITVISIDYRLAPEHRFPAASEDIEAVYRALLRSYDPKAIGIYGCSAGAILAAEAIARLQHLKLPLPGAVGTFCASLLDLSGDSATLGPALTGQAGQPSPRMKDLPYFAGTDPGDPLVLPGADPGVIAGFPPTLLITGSRDFAMSSVLRSHRLLVDQGVDAELHVWDGMWHSFFSDPDMPESREAYRVIANFFDARLAAGGAGP